jgi:cell division protein FtsA
MSKRPILTAIDVGTTKVCTIIADVDGGGNLRIVGVGIVPSTGLHKGMVTNINEARESIKASVRKAQQACGYTVESAYIGVTGRHVASMNNKGVVAITRGDRLVKTDDLKRVLHCAQNVKVPSDRRMLHVIPRNYAIDGQSGIDNPVGMHGFRLDVETHIITAAVTSIQNMVKCIRSIDIDIEDLVLEPLASSEAVLTHDEKHDGVILADIGGGTTDIAVFKEGSIWHTAVIPVAGYQFTRDISLGLGIPFDVAEQMKKRYGSVMQVYDSRTQDQAASLSQDGHGVSYQDLCDILRARVEEVLRLIMLEMPRGEQERLAPGGLVLTGGSCNLAGMAELGLDLLRIPVRVGAPMNMYGIAENLLDPAYATGVGLLLWGAKHEGKRIWKDSNALSSGLKRLAGRLFGLLRQ